MTEIQKMAVEAANDTNSQMGSAVDTMLNRAKAFQDDGSAAYKEAPIETQNFDDIEGLNKFLDDFTLSDEDIEKLKESYANDNNIPDLPTDPDKICEILNQVEDSVKSQLSLLKVLPLTEEEYLKRFRKVQMQAAYQLLAEYMIGQDLLSIKSSRGLDMKSKRREADGKKTKEAIIKMRYPRLKSRQIRDFQNLRIECVWEAIKIAFEREEIPSRSMALSHGVKKNVSQRPKPLPVSLKKYYPQVEDFGEFVRNLETEEIIYACSLFANIGVGTSLLEKFSNIRIAVANEYIERRAKVHRRLCPDCEVIQGDISDSTIFERVMGASKVKGCKICFASPPCQQASQQNTSASKGKKPEARLFKEVIDAAKLGIFDCFVVENVPQWPDSKPEIAADILNGKTIGEYMLEGFDNAGYCAKIYIINAADYGTAEARERCFILAWKKDLPTWKVPNKYKFRPTVYDAIGKFLSLANGEVDPNCVWHYALPLTESEINVLAHTPTGCSAWNNKAMYCPVNKDGSASRAQILRTYTRIDPTRPKSTITSDSGSIGGINTIHYGRPLTDETYSDCRVLSIAELLALMGCEPDFLDPLLKPTKLLENGKEDEEDFDGLKWENSRLVPADERFIRDALGEHVCPRLLLNLLSTIPLANVSVRLADANLHAEGGDVDPE